jgi:hypothetical protein
MTKLAVNSTLLNILRATSAVFLISSTISPGKWAIIIITEVPGYYVFLACFVYVIYILAFSRALKNLPSAKYLLAIALIGRLAMELTVPHTLTAFKMCGKFPDFGIITFLAVYIVLFATIIPLYVLVRLIMESKKIK